MRTLGLATIVCVMTACGSRVEPQVIPTRSCAAAGPGAGQNCGPGGNLNCCATVEIPGGTYNRLNDARFPASVSAFRMDTLEVTVGRYRAFINALPGSKPKPGDGAHPKVAGSGWKAEWDSMLGERADMESRLSCSTSFPPGGYVTWTATPGANEKVPVNCVSWYDAFAFCAWDGGRLPTDAEWGYVASGGAEQRRYPWGASAPDASLATIAFAPAGPFTPAGSAPAGATRWGVLDFGGSRMEYVRDGAKTDRPQDDVPTPCIDCIRMDNSLERFFLSRDVHWRARPEVDNVTSEYGGVTGGKAGGAGFGIRCVR